MIYGNATIGTTGKNLVREGDHCCTKGPVAERPVQLQLRFRRHPTILPSGGFSPAYGVRGSLLSGALRNHHDAGSAAVIFEAVSPRDYCSRTQVSFWSWDLVNADWIMLLGVKYGLPQLQHSTRTAAGASRSLSAARRLAEDDLQISRQREDQSAADGKRKNCDLE